jgi:hypothetical protein
MPLLRKLLVPLGLMAVNGCGVAFWASQADVVMTLFVLLGFSCGLIAFTLEVARYEVPRDAK